jgi:hypothetical protein
MKAKIVSVAAVSLLTSASFAQNTTRAKMPVDGGISSQGVRISIVRPTLDMKIEAKFDGQTFSGTAKPDSALGVAVGYAKLPVEELGFTTNLSLIEAKVDSSVNIVRLDGNLGYAINKHINLKGGLNTMKFTSGDTVKDFNPGLGYQLSLGLQLNKNVGLDIGYSELNSSGKLPVTSDGVEIDKLNMDLKMSGLEVGLSATF